MPRDKTEPMIRAVLFLLPMVRPNKRRYWKCVDCASMINDENMLFDDSVRQAGYVEFCYGCMNYNPEVIISYD